MRRMNWVLALAQSANRVPRLGMPLTMQFSGDFILSLAVRRHMTGYALLRFRDLLPLQQLVLQTTCLSERS